MKKVKLNLVRPSYKESPNIKVTKKTDLYCEQEGFKRAEKLKPRKRHIYGTYLMCIPNFNFLAQFGEKLCEKRTQEMKKMRKTDQETIFFGAVRGCNGVENLEP